MVLVLFYLWLNKIANGKDHDYPPRNLWLVCKESLTSISKRLSIPYTHLQKVCRELSIQVPSTGYWMRKMHGKYDDQIPLPQGYSGVKEIKLYPVVTYWGNPKELTFHSKFQAPKEFVDAPFPFTVSKRLTDTIAACSVHFKEFIKVKTRARIISDRFKYALWQPLPRPPYVRSLTRIHLPYGVDAVTCGVSLCIDGNPCRYARSVERMEKYQPF